MDEGEGDPAKDNLMAQDEVAHLVSLNGSVDEDGGSTPAAAGVEI